MSAQFLARICFHNRNSLSDSFLNPLVRKIPKFPKSQTLIFRMVADSWSTKRPTCPSCSKPTRICLCNRLKSPSLDNSVSVTILQHSLEKKHPLNSTRIATLGLKNIDVVAVSDVNFQAQFVISLLKGSCEMGPITLDESSHVFDEMLRRVECVGRRNIKRIKPSTDVTDAVREIHERNDFDGAEMHEICESELHASGNSCKDEVASSSFYSNEERGNGIGEVFVASKSLEACCDKKELALRCSEGINFSFTIEKNGAICSLNSCQMVPSKRQKMSLDELLASDTAFNVRKQGFIVEKFQRKLLEESNEYDENQEYDLVVPPGSVLLFPSERSIDVGAVDFEVKNLIVLDGTWAKAKRMYNENPWLQFLPHIRLELDKLSLYSEVRHQPRAGYLSTIESIVYALKAVGESSKELDGLLHVFESMVGDQRRCKNERLKALSS